MTVRALAAALARQLSVAEGSGGGLGSPGPAIWASTSEPAAATTMLPVLDLVMLDRIRELGDDQVEKLVSLFESETRVRLRAVREALTAGDRQRLSKLAHSLVGSSASFGATALAEHCRALEHAAPDTAPARLAAALGEIESDFEEAYRALHGAVASSQPAGTSPSS